MFAHTQNIPQLIIQSIYLSTTEFDDITFTVYISMIFSLLSILFSISFEVSRICSVVCSHEKKYSKSYSISCQMDIKTPHLKKLHRFSSKTIHQSLRFVIDRCVTATLKTSDDISYEIEIKNIIGNIKIDKSMTIEFDAWLLTSATVNCDEIMIYGDDIHNKPVDTEQQMAAIVSHVNPTEKQVKRQVHVSSDSEVGSPTHARKKMIKNRNISLFDTSKQRFVETLQLIGDKNSHQFCLMQQVQYIIHCLKIIFIYFNVSNVQLQVSN